MKTKVLLTSPDDSGMHPLAEIIEVDIPAGYRRVWTGALCPGDMHLGCIKALLGIVEWVPIKKMPTTEEVKRREIYSTASWFACIIRPGEGQVSEACERCEVEPKVFGHRFCRGCCAAVCADGRKAVLA